MTQVSAPQSGEQFTDTSWRDLFGDEPGIVGDIDGSAYKLTLAANSDVASIGSATQASLARVAGFSHKIPAGEPVSVTIPTASGSPRTDIISIRYNPDDADPASRLLIARIAGSSANLPTYDSSPPGVEDFPLWAITRAPSQALSAATVVDLRVRVAPVLTLPVGAPLPLSSPLGTIAWQGNTQYRRVLGSALTPVWDGAAAGSGIFPVPALGGWTGRGLRIHTDGANNRRFMSGYVTPNNSFNPTVGTHTLAQIPNGVRPTLAAGESFPPFFRLPVASPTGSNASLAVDVDIQPDGNIVIKRGPNQLIAAGTPISFHGVNFL